MNQVTFEEIAGEVLEEVTADALLYFQRALASKGLVLTAELMQSFRYHIISNAQQVSADIEFRDYGRFKDMRRLRYQGQPPADAMEFFVNKIGVNNFAFVPGYKADRRVPTVNNAIKRIASGVSFSKKGRTQNRKYSGTWYNETKMDMINVAKGRLAAKTDQWVRWQMKQQGEAEV